RRPRLRCRGSCCPFWSPRASVRTPSRSPSLSLPGQRCDAVTEGVEVTEDPTPASGPAGHDVLDPVAPDLELVGTLTRIWIVLAPGAVAAPAVVARHVERRQGNDGNRGPVRAAREVRRARDDHRDDAGVVRRDRS